jgi:hypothetical protein
METLDHQTGAFAVIHPDSQDQIVEQVRKVLREELQQPLRDLTDHALRVGMVKSARATACIPTQQIRGATVLHLRPADGAPEEATTDSDHHLPGN